VLCSTIWKGHQMRNYWQDTKQREEMNNEKKTEFVKMKGTRLETEYKQMKETERKKRRGREIQWPRPLLLILLSLQLAVVWMMDTWPPSPAAILFRTAFFLAVTNTRSTFGERCLPPCSQLMMGCSVNKHKRRVKSKDWLLVACPLVGAYVSLGPREQATIIFI